MYEFQVRVLRGWLGEVDAFPKVRRKLDTASEKQHYKRIFLCHFLQVPLYNLYTLLYRVRNNQNDVTTQKLKDLDGFLRKIEQ